MAPKDDEKLAGELAILNRLLERIDARLDPLSAKVDGMAATSADALARLRVAEDRILGIKADQRRVTAWLLVSLAGALAWALARMLLP